MGLVAGPDPQVGIDLGKGILGGIVAGEDVDAEVLVAVGRLVIVVGGLRDRCWRSRAGP